jgi:hypothetical protein
LTEPFATSVYPNRIYIGNLAERFKSPRPAYRLNRVLLDRLLRRPAPAHKRVPPSTVTVVTKEEISMKLLRGRLLAGATAGLAASAILHWPANAAEFTYKCGASLPDGHPMAVRVREAIAQIKRVAVGSTSRSTRTAFSAATPR